MIIRTCNEANPRVILLQEFSNGLIASNSNARDARVAIILAEFMPGVDDTDLRSHCVQHFRPEFSARAKNGSRVI